MRSLRLRFILSHVLPLMIIIPLMGIILIYAIETRILIPELTRELEVEAKLVDSLILQEADFQLDRSHAQTFLEKISPSLSSRMMLFDSEGRLLASSDPEDEGRIGEVFNDPSLRGTLKGIPSTQQKYSRNLETEITDLWKPITGSDGEILGVLRLSHQLGTTLEDFLQVRYIIGAVLLGGLFLGVAMGWGLAAGLSSPIMQVVKGARNLASGLNQEPLAVRGSTETRTLIETFNLLVERLQGAERSRRRLLANLVHELGRPLGAMGSAIQSLLMGAGKDEGLRQELLTGINAQIRGLKRLLDDLALLHEQVLGELDVDLKDVDMNLWLPQMLSTWREAARLKEINWSYNQEDRLPVMAIDPERLDQAAGNLLSNAIKFTPKGGEITVTARLEESAFVLYVRDTGAGINPEEIEEIFTPFFRGSQGRRFPQGMGLGLNIARDIVVAHGGSIEVQSAPGKGSTFTIHLPLTKS